MQKKPGADALLASGMIALALGGVSIGYRLCSMVNEFDGGAVLTGAGGGLPVLPRS